MLNYYFSELFLCFFSTYAIKIVLIKDITQTKNPVSNAYPSEYLLYNSGVVTPETTAANLDKLIFNPSAKLISFPLNHLAIKEDTPTIKLSQPIPYKLLPASIT